MTAMAPAISWVKHKLLWLGASLKSQWLATALVIPLCFFILQTHTARQDAKEARVQSINVDRITKIQDSGKALDLALAGYFQSIADLGLAERQLRMPGDFKTKPVDVAQASVVQHRDEARNALAEHASDVQRLRGALEEDASTQYMAALATISTTVEGSADIENTGKYITVLSRLVVARNAMVDKAVNKIS